MRLNYFFLFISIFFIFTLYSQEAVVKDTVWKTGGNASINFTQAYYENWTAGGIPSVAGIGFLKVYATYQKDSWRWDNQLDLGYGLLSEREKLERKTDDKINFDSKLGYLLGNSWYGSFLTTFKSQFTPGYEDPDFQLVKISDFLAPAYVMASLGADFNPNDNFSFFIAPAALKATFVTDQELANQGAYGVDAAEWEVIDRGAGMIDSTFIEGKNARYEIGGHLKIMFKTKVVENVDFQSKLELYANYFENFGNIDMNWEGLINMKINGFLSANIRVELIYDDDIAVLTSTDDAGNQTFGPRMQIKELFGLGLSYNF